MKNIMKEILSTSIYLLVVLCAAYLIITYVGQRTQVSGSSMETTLSDGDNLLVDKITYRFRNRSGLILLFSPFNMIQIHITLNELLECLAKQCR